MGGAISVKNGSRVVFFDPFFFDDALFEFWNQTFSDSPGFSDRIDGFEVFDSYMDDAQAWVMKIVEHHH